MVYLFTGQDTLAKDLKLKELKDELLPKNISDFNLDILYAKELKLFSFQEKLLSLPVKVKKRLIVIKQAELLSQEIKDFILRAIKQMPASAALVLDMDKLNLKDAFSRELSRHARLYRFKEAFKPDAFTLSRLIAAKQGASALGVLAELLSQGEKPERILGGLRYVWEKENDFSRQAEQKLKNLLTCDIEIKTGKLKADFALEKLVVELTFTPLETGKPRF